MKTLKLDENDLRRELFSEAIGIITEERNREGFFFWYKLLVFGYDLYIKSLLVLIPAYVIINILNGGLNTDKVFITILMLIICSLSVFVKYHTVRSFSTIYYILHKHEHEEWE